MASITLDDMLRYVSCVRLPRHEIFSILLQCKLSERSPVICGRSPSSDRDVTPASYRDSSRTSRPYGGPSAMMALCGDFDFVLGCGVGRAKASKSRQSRPHWGAKRRERPSLHTLGGAWSGVGVLHTSAPAWASAVAVC